MPYLRAPIYGITGNTGERRMTVSDKAEFWRVQQAIVSDETAKDALPERHVEVEMSEITGRTVKAVVASRC